MSGFLGGPGIGVGFNPALAIAAISTSTPEVPAFPFVVGTRFYANNNSTWVFCIAGGSITANDVVLVTTNSTWTVQAMTSTLAKGKLGQFVGIAGATATTGQGLWVQTTGYNAAVNATTGQAAFTVLSSTATGGRIGAAVGGTSAKVTGLVLLATAASNTAACYLTGAAVGTDD